MRKLLYVLAAVFLIGLAIAIPTYLLLADDPPPDTSDLVVERPDIPQDQNAWTYFARATEKTDWPEFASPEEDRFWAARDEEEWDADLVEHWLERNAEAMEVWRVGVRQSESVMPVPERWLDAELPELKEMRTIARAATIHAMSLHRRGEHQAAFDELLRTVRTGHLLQNSRGPLICYLTGVTVRHIGTETWLRLLPASELEPEALVEFVRELERYERSKDGLQDTFRVEYAFFAQVIEDVARGKLNGDDAGPGLSGYGGWAKTPLRGFVYKPNRTLRMVADHIRSSIGNVPRTWAETEMPELPALPEGSGPAHTARLLWTGNPVGHMLIALLLPATERLLEQKCNDRLNISALRVMLALKAHRARTGHLPQSLEDLVPEYLPAVPADPFDGEPLRYSPDRGIVYSVGSNLQDTGGSEGDERWRMDDPTFRIEF